MPLSEPEVQQLAIYTGWLLSGRRGGLVAGTLFVLPATERPTQVLVDDHRALETEVEVAGPCVARIGRNLSEDPLGSGCAQQLGGTGTCFLLRQRGGLLSRGGPRRTRTRMASRGPRQCQMGSVHHVTPTANSAKRSRSAVLPSPTVSAPNTTSNGLSSPRSPRTRDTRSPMAAGCCHRRFISERGSRR